MSTTNNLPQPALDGQHNRRTFLTRALALAGALPFVHSIQPAPPTSEQTTPPIIAGCQCPHCSPELWKPAAPPRPADYPDPARIAAINRYWWEIQKLRIAIDRFDDLITQARVQAPDQVDGYALFESMNEAAIAAGKLDDFLISNDSIIEYCTGAPATVYCIEDEIINRRGTYSPDRLRVEIDYLRADYPAQAARLAAMLDGAS